MTILYSMFAPQPNETFVAASANSYLSAANNIIYNVLAGDIASLQTIGCVLLLPRNNISATRAPLSSDDYTAGYGEGSVWNYINGSSFTQYGCTSMGTTPGSAVWNALEAISVNVPASLNQTESITGTYSVVTGDIGNTLVASNGFYSITFGVVGGYADNHWNWVVNADTYASQGSGTEGAGKTIVLDNATPVSFILWPGQSVLIAICNGVWFAMPNGGQNPGQAERWKIPSNCTFFVTTAGNDANDGLSTSTPWRNLIPSFSKMYQLFDFNNNDPTLSLGAGTWQENVTTAGTLDGASVAFVIGDGSANTTWQPATTGASWIIADLAIWETASIEFDASNLVSGTNYGVFLHQVANIDFNTDIKFGSFSGSYVASDHGASTADFNQGYTIAGNFTEGVSLGGGGILTQTGGVTITATGTPTGTTFYQINGAGANISLGTSITYAGSYHMGMQKYTVNGPSFLSLSGNTVPGSVAGATSNGGVAA